MKSFTCEDSSLEQLLLEYLPQVQYIARRIHRRLPPQVPIEDLIQCGILGLMDAVRRYDASKKVRLKHYAEYRIRGAILDSLREIDGASRGQRRMGRKMWQAIARCRAELGRDPTEAETAAAMGVKLESLQRLKSELRTLETANLHQETAEAAADNATGLSAAQEDDPYHQAMKSELAKLVQQGVGGLSARERELVDMYYFEERTMKEIGAAMGLGESRVSQIHSSILSRLRSSLRSSRIC